MKTKKFLLLGWMFLFVFSGALSGAARANDLAEDIPGDQEELPLPGDQEQLRDDFPAPSLGKEAQGTADPVGEAYLPPAGADSVYLPGGGTSEELPVAGAHMPTVFGGMSGEELFPRETNLDRPSFQLYLGGGTKAYPTILVPDTVPGVGFGVSYRAFRLGQTVFLHAMGEITYFYVGSVGAWAAVKDKTYHAGGLFEFAMGRKFSLLGGLIWRWNDITTDPYKGSADEERKLFNIGEERRLHLGVGFQYDFHVIPHGSLGARFYVEQDYGMLSFVMAIEPAPAGKSRSLNYRGL